MKANPRRRALPTRLVSIPVLALAALASGCVPPPASAPAPAPAPTPAAQPVRPAPLPAATALPSPSNWRDAPITPGTWAWTPSGPRSVANFAAGAFEMRCDTQSATITLFRRANAAGAGPASMAITTMSGTQTLAAQVRQGYFTATLPARSPLLDQMAFSRGRFAVAVSGQPTLYIPSWTEVSRVIEDCR
ncbi:hypothetical protein HT136_09565 [Novosphingobium profundi]|uniref:hypothetical protein n=1 Tax=Novosphingobium profundi TaxID=1774954 RepID=UPI001FE2894D|nr:hypothetical protein [Novosphingobium profundi]MBT0668615.1 hypothetical protein [Novosphingobium profundi]